MAWSAPWLKQKEKRLDCSELEGGLGISSSLPCSGFFTLLCFQQRFFTNFWFRVLSDSLPFTIDLMRGSLVPGTPVHQLFPPRARADPLTGYEPNRPRSPRGQNNPYRAASRTGFLFTLLSSFLMRGSISKWAKKRKLSWGTMSLCLNECVAPLHGCVGSRTALLAGSYSSCKKSDALLRVFRRKHLLRGRIVLSHCVLPPVHIGQDLVYSGITGYEPFTKR